MIPPPCLQLLFPELPAISDDQFAAMLRAYHPDLRLVGVQSLPVPVESESGDGPPAATFCQLAWSNHTVKVIGFATAMPATAIDACLHAALLPPEIKDDARKHQAHILLYYAGSHADPLEHLVALAAVAGVMAECGAIVTLNEEARTAILSTDLLPDQPGEDMLAVLRALPIPYLYGGFVKLTLSDTPGIWMRTFANHRLNLPNLAYRASSHDEGQATFRRFAGLLGYLRETQLPLEIGETIRIDDDAHFRIREPEDLEWWLQSEGPMRVLDRVQLEHNTRPGDLS